MKYEGTSTLSKIGENRYNLLIQDSKGHVIVFKRAITFKDAVVEIENRMYLTDNPLEEE